MSATNTPSIINLPLLPKPQNVQELANTINFTYREINRGFVIIGNAFTFDKTISDGNKTVIGTQIGGFLISTTSLISTDTTDTLRIGINAYKPGSPSFSFFTGDTSVAGTQGFFIGNGIIYGFLVTVGPNTVVQMRRGLYDNHGYLSIRKENDANVFTVNGNTNICSVGGNLTVAGTVTALNMVVNTTLTVTTDLGVINDVNVNHDLNVVGNTYLQNLSFGSGGTFKFPNPFVIAPAVVTGYVVAQSSTGQYVRLAATPV